MPVSLTPKCIPQGPCSRMAALWLCLLLSACVTETTGGFSRERSDSEALQSYLQLAVGYLEQNDLANAKRHLNNAANIDPNNSEMSAIWGLVYSREGETRLADDSFRRALRINESNSQARNNYAAFLFANGRFDDAYRELERVVQDTQYVARPQAFENLGLAALRLNRLDEAEAAFGRALQLNRNQLRSSLELASIHLQKRNVEQANTFFRNYLTILQFYNQGHNARSLWVGVQLENALGNDANMREYGAQLEANYSASAENQLYQQLLDTLNNE